MAKSERDYLLELWSKNVCPYCGNAIPKGKRVGAGDKSEGGFCSLDCYAHYYEQELKNRARKVAELARRAGRS
jgi:hypothetical protein